VAGGARTVRAAEAAEVAEAAGVAGDAPVAGQSAGSVEVVMGRFWTWRAWPALLA